MKKFLLVLVAVFGVIQFFQIDKTNPPVEASTDFTKIYNTPENIAQTLKTSCYDCHSNETVYPWYSNIQPFAWFLKSHIDEGRRKLNFSEFGSYEPKRQAHKLFESQEVISEGEMPMQSYLIMHSEAKLSDVQQKELVEYFKKTEQEVRTKNNLPAEEKKGHH